MVSDAARGTAEERVYRTLRDDIVSGLLAPGQPLGEEAVAARCAVSRTPVRQAIRRLEHDGLVVLHGSRGAIVREIAARDVVEVFQLRQALECFAVETAGAAIDVPALEQLAHDYDALERGEATVAPEVFHWGADTKLHQLVIAAARNRRMTATLELHSLQLSRVHALFWRMDDALVDDRLARSRADAAREHRELIGVLLEGRYGHARDLLFDHLRRGSDDLVHLLATVAPDAPLSPTTDPAGAPDAAAPASTR